MRNNKTTLSSASNHKMATTDDDEDGDGSWSIGSVEINDKNNNKDGGEPTTTHDGGDSTSNSSPSVVLAHSETKTLLGIKILFVLVLLLSAAGAFGVFFYIRGKETADFETQFVDDATKILASIGANLDNTLGAADAFVASMISTARETNQT